jgi:hypothetical protein
MICFPQLATGALAQLPLKRHERQRTITNVLPDGSVVKSPDPNAARIHWELRYSGLTDAERSALESFFVLREGRLRTFLFLDPTDNLLRWSEDPGRDVWERDPLLHAATAEDPFEELEATRLTNVSQTVQGIEQTVGAPGWFRYSFSVYVRAAEPARVTLALTNGEGTIESHGEARAEWRRLSCSGAIAGSAEEITCRLEVPAGASVDVFGFQLEPQPIPSPYQKTGSRGGVYPKTRFAMDSLEWRTHGMDDHAGVMWLVSRTGD